MPYETNSSKYTAQPPWMLGAILICILSLFTECDHDLEKEDLKKISVETDGWSPFNIKSLIDEAIREQNWMTWMKAQFFKPVRLFFNIIDFIVTSIMALVGAELILCM